MTCPCQVSSRLVSLGGLRFRLRPSLSPSLPETPPPRQTDDREATDGPKDPRFGEITNKGKRHARVSFGSVRSLSKGCRSVSFQEGPSETTRPTRLGKRATERQPTVQKTPDSRKRQTRVNGMPVSSFKSVRLSQRAPGPSLSATLPPTDGTRSHPGKRATEGRPTVQTTPDSERLQKRVDDMLVYGFVWFLCI